MTEVKKETTMIEIKNVSLRYNNTLALNNINLKLPAQAICGLLGRNGAGKTSLLSLLSSYIRPTSGTVMVDGEDPYENPDRMPNIAFIHSQHGEAEKNFKVKEVLNIAATLRPNWDAAYADRLIEMFQISKKKKMGQLSAGMRSAVYVVVGLAGQTPITIYDEAYVGMDAAVRKLFIKELLADYTLRPKLILFSTHFVDEMDGLFNEAIIIDDGQILAYDDVDVLRAKGVAVSGLSAAVDQFTDGREVLSERTLGQQKEAVLFGALSESDRQAAVREGLEFAQPSLQDLFIYMTEKGGGAR